MVLQNPPIIYTHRVYNCGACPNVLYSSQRLHK